jgi:hypothetical protein
VQLAPGADFTVSRSAHVLLAITAVDLTLNGTDQKIEMGAQEVTILPDRLSSKLVNTGQHSSQFIILAF